MRRLGASMPALLILLAGLPCGCGTRSQFPERVPVSGKVTYKGKALTSGSILFLSDRGHLAVGEIQPDGSFHLSTAGNRDGATLGHHRVSVTTGTTDPSLMPGTSPGYTPPPRVIPDKYAHPESSGLDVEIRKETHDLEINLP